MMKSGQELKGHLQELVGSPGLSHLVPGHGAVISGGAKDALGEALGRL
jgi:hypothetical protein